MEMRERKEEKKRRDVILVVNFCLCLGPRLLTTRGGTQDSENC